MSAPRTRERVPATECGSGNGEPLIGAIRWDAWIPSNVDLNWVKASIYTKYSNRQPIAGWYTGGMPDTEVAQDAMDAEIDAAATAGLDYWAFDWYPTENEKVGKIQEAFEHYLTSNLKSRIKFALVLQAAWLAYPDKSWSLYDSSFLPRFVEWFRDPQYLKVCNGEPLVFLFSSGDIPTERLLAMRDATHEAGLADPYFVDVNRNILVAAAEGMPAVSSYGPNGARVRETGHVCWSRQRDRDVENRSDLRGRKFVVGLTPMADPRPRNYGYWVDQPTYGEWESHLVEAFDWMRKNPGDVTDPPTALIYSWNELDEGGPGITPTEQEGTRYLDAITPAKHGRLTPDYWDQINTTHCSITTGGNWNWAFPDEGIQGNYDNDEHQSSEAGARLSVAADSSVGVEVIGTRGPDRGFATVALDGADAGMIDLYRPEHEQRAVLFSRDDLALGDHTIDVTVVGEKNDLSSDDVVGVDSIRWHKRRD